MKKLLFFLTVICLASTVNAQDTSKTKETKTAQTNNDDLFKNLTKKGNKVFIISLDAAEVLHATTAINFWGYWNVTTIKDDANLILKIDSKTIEFGHKRGKMIFVDPKTMDEIKETNTLVTVGKGDLNRKRQFINRLIEEEVKPMIK